MNKHERVGIQFDKSTTIAIIDSFDGANHFVTEDGSISVMSFSSQIVSPQIIQQGYTCAQSINILTWQQVMAKETAQNIFPSVYQHYKKKMHFATMI